MQSVRQCGLVFLACLSLVLLSAASAYGESAGERTGARGADGACTDMQYDCARYEGDDTTPARSDYPDYPADNVEVLPDPEPVADTSPPRGGIDSGGGAMADASVSTSVLVLAALSGVFALAALAAAVGRRVRT